MREIKFRAWIKDDKIMDNVLALTFGKICGGVYTEECEGVYTEECGWLPIEQVEFMQYTGLKDKNGKEIYEGDIILWGSTLYEVIYVCDGYKVKYIKNHNPNYLYDFTLASLIDCGIEIIGNIYENPELLEEDK